MSRVRIKVCMEHGWKYDDENPPPCPFCKIARLRERVGELEDRLQISPYGDDKIDELESCIDHLRHRLTCAERERDEARVQLADSVPVARVRMALNRFARESCLINALSTAEWVAHELGIDLDARDEPQWAASQIARLRERVVGLENDVLLHMHSGTPVGACIAHWVRERDEARAQLADSVPVAKVQKVLLESEMKLSDWHLARASRLLGIPRIKRDGEGGEDV